MNPEPRAPRAFRSLSVKLVLRILMLGILLTILMTVAISAMRYEEEKKLAMEQLSSIARSHNASLANSLWDLDMQGLRLQLEAISQAQIIGQVLLSTSTGPDLVINKYESLPEMGSYHEQLFYTTTLHSPGHPDQAIGTLTLTVDPLTFLGRLENDTLRILLAELVRGFLFSLLFIWLMSRYVTRHLAALAGKVAALGPNSMNQSFALERPPHAREDELDQLSDAFANMQQGLSDYIQRQQELELQIREHRDDLARLVAQRTQSLQELNQFHSMIVTALTHFMHLPVNESHSAINNLLDSFCTYFKINSAILFLHDAQQQQFRAHNIWPLGDTHELILPDATLRPTLFKPETANWYGVACNQQIRDAAADALLGPQYCMSCVTVPSRTVALLCLRGALDCGTQGSLFELAAWVAASMLDHQTQQLQLLQTQDALKLANQDLYRLSRHDALTGLANRRYFDEVKTIEFNRAVRSGLPLSVIMCDLDQFKNYNDFYGHAQGDECLKAIGTCLQHLFTRASDLPARLGGEEFAVLLPNTKGSEAYALAERLRLAVWNLNLPHARSSVAERVTVSIGVASLKLERHQHFDRLLQEADAALYQAKSRSRNLVVMGQ